MKTIEERVGALETQAAAAAAAGVAGFGPAAPVDAGGGDLWPEGTVSSNGSALQWNPQPGAAGFLIFRGPTDFQLVPDPNADGSPFTGTREIAISKLAPQFDQVSVTLDDDPKDLGSVNYAQITVWFSVGKARTLHVVPSGNDRALGGCGKVEFVGKAL